MEFKDYLSLGWYLTPLVKGEKKPFIVGWNKKENLITEENNIDQYEGHNFGVALGPSKLISIDVDCLDSTRLMFDSFGIDFMAIVAGAPRIRSRENKDKYLFANTHGFDTTKKIAWPKKDDPTKSYCVIEFRSGDGSQDVLPPSIHPVTQRPYYWATEPTGNIPELPKELFAIINDWEAFRHQLENACPWSTEKKTNIPKTPKNNNHSEDSVISKFNNAHDVGSILESHGYKKIKKDRYLSPNSTTNLPGCNIINEQWVYNNHKSDHWCDKTLDAFGLFCELDCEGNEELALEKACEMLEVEWHDISDEMVQLAEISMQQMESEKQKQLTADIAECVSNANEYDADKLKRPENLIPKNGILGEMVKYILESSIRRQPSLAVGAAVSFLGAIIGRRYASETDLRTNVYCIGLAPSGSGKEHARKCIDKIATKAELNKYIGGENLTSGSAAIAALKRNPTQLFKIDEFGLFLQTLTGAKSDPHKKDLMTKFMSLYSSAGSVYRGTEYANQDENSRTDIYCPNLCIYGTSTNTEFCSALSSNQASNGSLARFVIFEGEKKRPKRSKPSDLEPPKSLVSKLKELKDFMSKNHDGSTNVSADLDLYDSPPETILVRSTLEVEKMIDDLDEYLDDFINMSDAAGSIYSRVIENAIKLSVIYAVSINFRNPKIDKEAFDWGTSIALWSANNIMMQMANSVSDNYTEKMTKRVLQEVIDRGSNGISKEILVRRSLYVDNRQRDMILKDLVESRTIILKKNRYYINDASGT